MDVITNKHFIHTQDIYILSYYGIKVILQVARVTEDTVFLVELATKKYKEGFTLTKHLSTSKNPLVVEGNNNRSSTTYEVPTREDKRLPIKIGFSSKLFSKAIATYNGFPIAGTYLAIPFDDFLSTYWTCPKEKEKDEYISN